MNKLLRKVVRSMGLKWLTGQVRAAAEGKLGPRWKAIYWSLEGKKRLTSYGLGLLSGVLTMAGYLTAAEVVLGLGAFAFTVGWADEKWRDTSAVDHWFLDSAIGKFMANNSPTIASLLTASLYWLHSPACTVGDWCGRGAVGVVLLGYAFVHVGVLDAAWNSPPPAKV